MIHMALPAASIQTAGMKKPTVIAASTARVGYSVKASEAIMNENTARVTGLDITAAGLPRSGESK